MVKKRLETKFEGSRVWFGISPPKPDRQSLKQYALIESGGQLTINWDLALDWRTLGVKKINGVEVFLERSK